MRILRQEKVRNKRENASKGKEVCKSGVVSPASQMQFLHLNSLRRSEAKLCSCSRQFGQGTIQWSDWYYIYKRYDPIASYASSQGLLPSFIYKYWTDSKPPDQDQRPKPHATSISQYTSKHFEIGLSPIIEDTHTFANTLRGPKSVEKKLATSDMVDSSESSYGELIQKKVRFFSWVYSRFAADEQLSPLTDLAWLGLERFSCFKYACTHGLISL